MAITEDLLGRNSRIKSSHVCWSAWAKGLEVAVVKLLVCHNLTLEPQDVMIDSPFEEKCSPEHGDVIFSKSV